MTTHARCILRDTQTLDGCNQTFTQAEERGEVANTLNSAKLKQITGFFFFYVADASCQWDNAECLALDEIANNLTSICPVTMATSTATAIHSSNSIDY